MATAQKRNVPARAAAKPKAKEPEMFEVLTEVDADGNVDIKVFGEKFTISTDVNGWLLLLAGSGSSRDVVNLVKSIIVVPDDGDVEVARMREMQRFNDVLGKRSKFTVDDAITLVNSLTEVSAGNAD